MGSQTPSLRGAPATRQSIKTQHSGLLRHFIPRNGECGNALWFILVAIGLLGLLTVMMSRSSSTTNETGGYEQNVIQANQILSYAKSMENAVQNLLARGCSENDISFWHDSDGNGAENASDDYFNANSPNDRSCHIFDVAGAGMTWETPNQNWLDRSESAKFNYGDYYISGLTTVQNIESNSRDDLLFMISWVNSDLCESINDLLFNDTMITEDPGSWGYSSYFTGGYDTASSSIDLSSFTAHDGANTACFTSQNEGGFHFYHVLHAR